MSLTRKFYNLSYSWRVAILFSLGIFMVPQIVAIITAAFDVFVFEGNLLPSTPTDIDAVLFPWYIKIVLALSSVITGLVLVKLYAKRNIF